jgi:2-polyprenyl-3-methyl-5-hydroxy-6-metoxy-1,4-benzoquinol methylase
MYGTGEIFDYLECSNCGCLQIIKVPKNISKYYLNENYYSFETKNRLNSVIRYIINKRDEYCLLKNSYLGRLINIKYKNTFFSILGGLNLNYNSKILDVGCGSGKFLLRLKELKFKQLTGIEPYIDKEINTNTLIIKKKTLDQLSNKQKFDLIIFSHSFEHMIDPHETLMKVRNILSQEGICIIRMPVKSEYIWNNYGINWVQIDAPRHFFVFTITGFKILVKNAGLKLKNTIFDSTEFQFWGSEQYKRNIPLESENSYKNNPKKSIFTKDQINSYKENTKHLNKENLGDQAIFILKKS